MLRRVAERLRQCLKKSDIVARLGGDEFVVVKTGIRRNVEATKLAEKIIEAVGAPYDLEGRHADIGVNVGLAFVPKDGQSLDQLIKAADIALYRAKASGRGTYRRFEPGMDADLQARQEMKVSLRHALENEALELYYQPLINLHTGRICTCEALVRWKHPEKGPVSPAEFISIAEETGLIGPLGEWILRKACTEAARWPSQVSVAVNLSPVQFRNLRLATVIRDILNETGLEASRLQLEITESVFLNESDSNLHVLQQIRQLGAKIAMDDFGTGYSSLGYLRSFRFDKIKVDRSFIADLPTGRESLEVLRRWSCLRPSTRSMKRSRWPTIPTIACMPVSSQAISTSRSTQPTGSKPGGGDQRLLRLPLRCHALRRLQIWQHGPRRCALRLRGHDSAKGRLHQPGVRRSPIS